MPAEGLSMPAEGLSMPVEGRGQRFPNRAYRIREFVKSRGSRDPRAEGLALRVASLPTVFRFDMFKHLIKVAEISPRLYII